MNWKTPLTAALVLAAGSFAPAALAQDGSQQQPAAEATAEGTITVRGKLELPADPPAGIDMEGMELSKVAGTLMWEVPQVPVPYPDGFEQMTDDEKRAWAAEFSKTDEYKEYVQKARARMEEQRQVQPIPVEFAEDGSFKVENLKPGSWVLRASIPHATMPQHQRAMFGQRLTLEADKEVVDLGTLTLEVQNVLLPGDAAPEWVAQAYDGGEIKLSDFRGKYVLIDFWATWCGPCKAEIPNLEAVYKDFGGEKFEMIGLSLDRSIDLPKAFHEENHSPYVHGYLGEWNKTETTARAYGVRGIPSIWLIGPDGKVVARDLRGERLREAVRQAVEGEIGAN